MKLYNSLKSLIVEIANVDSILDAIKRRRRVVIYYDGDDQGGKGLRLIEPVCLGYSTANNQVLRAWDVEGASYTSYIGKQPLPSWRLFRVDKILSLNPTGEIFDTIRPNFNTTGDKSMIKIIKIANFESQND